MPQLHALIPQLSAPIAALSAYFHARLQLLASESKEAASVLVVIAGLAIGAAFVLFLGYVLLIVFALFALSSAAEGRFTWIWLSFAAAFFHFGIAAALGYLAYRRISRPVFATTIAELKRDSLWLQTLTKTS